MSKSIKQTEIVTKGDNSEQRLGLMKKKRNKEIKYKRDKTENSVWTIQQNNQRGRERKREVKKKRKR